MEPEETKPTNETNETNESNEETKEVTQTKPKKQMSARARAEARRRRILESSAKRMNVVSGDVPATPAATDVSSPEVEENVVQDDEDDKDNEEKATVVEDDEPKKSTTGVSRSSSSRLAQMRRRRFKKEQKKETETTTVSEEKKAKDDDVKEDQTEAQNVTNDKPESPPETEETKPEPAPETNTGEQTGEEKKYLGVARMRRKRLAEKKKKEESEAMDTTAKTKNIVRHTPTEKVNTLPIYLHLFITLILFSVGVQIGLNQHSHIVWEDGMVVNELSVKESMIFSYFKKEESVIKSFSVDISPDVGMEDEFSTDEFYEAEVEENIDPIFRVDLDKLTEGPSFFNKIARMAIRCHRAIIAMIMFLPQTLLSIPHAIVTTKCYPYFFLISAFLRQGSVLFGATIPSKTDEDEESNKKDILSMMIAGAKDMIGRSVPGFSVLKFFYNMLQEGRDDMMVVSCGLLFGLVVPLMKRDGGYEDVGVISEEL